jgi:hypothetical protein
VSVSLHHEHFRLSRISAYLGPKRKKKTNASSSLQRFEEVRRSVGAQNLDTLAVAERQSIHLLFFSWTVAGSANAVATGARRRGGGVRRVSAHEGQLQVAPLPASHVARHAATASCAARDHGPSRGTPREPHARTLHSPSIRSDRPSERGEHPRATQATTSSIHRCPSPSRTPPAAST